MIHSVKVILSSAIYSIKLFSKLYFLKLEQKIYFEYKECIFEYLAVIMVWEAVMLEIIEREGRAI